MVLPAQTVRGPMEGTDPELAYALGERSASVRWVFPSELREVLARSPGVSVRIDALPVGMFMQAEINRVGDPLYGDLRRLAALTGADIALIPVEVRARADTASSGVARVEIAAALLSARTGRVYWFGIVEGESGAPHEVRTVASAAQALARRLVP